MVARVVALFLSILLSSTSTAQEVFPPLPDLRFAEIGAKANYTGDRWSYMAAGNRQMPAVVMLHGVGGNSMDWRFQRTA